MDSKLLKIKVKYDKSTDSFSVDNGVDVLVLSEHEADKISRELRRLITSNNLEKASRDPGYNGSSL